MRDRVKRIDCMVGLPVQPERGHKSYSYKNITQKFLGYPLFYLLNNLTESDTINTITGGNNEKQDIPIFVV